MMPRTVMFLSQALDEYEETKKCVRFAKPSSDEDIEKNRQEADNKNTLKSTKWSLNIWTAWMKHHSMTAPDDGEIPDLHEMSVADINKHLSRFVVEARKQNADDYPPRSIYLIMCGLLRHMREEGVIDKNFLDEHDSRFKCFQKTLDSRMRMLCSDGLGTIIHQADPIAPKKEAELYKNRSIWRFDRGSIATNCVFYNCKLFGLRGMDDHRQLQCEQIKTGHDSKGRFVEFTGKSSKSIHGGIKQRNVTSKNIRHYSTIPGSGRCLHRIYTRYLECVGTTGHFYHRP